MHPATIVDYPICRCRDDRIKYTEPQRHMTAAASILAHHAISY
jgi:hypothetical protein